MELLQALNGAKHMQMLEERGNFLTSGLQSLISIRDRNLNTNEDLELMHMPSKESTMYLRHRMSHKLTPSYDYEQYPQISTPGSMDSSRSTLPLCSSSFI